MTTLIKTDNGYAVRISLPDGIGSVHYTFNDIECFRADEINCVVLAEWFILDRPSARMESRLNIQSPSTRRDFIKDITDLAKVSLKESFIEATELVKDALRSEDNSHWFEEADAKGAEMLFEPFLVRGAPNMLFGKGEGAKTFTCLRIALSLATGKPFVGFTPKYRVKTLFIDYEDTASTCTDRIYKLASSDGLKDADLESIHGSIRYFNPRGSELSSVLRQIKKIIQEHNIGLVIVDSAVSACGGEPEKADVVRRYFNSLASLGVTTLTIAHETKSENHQYAFGSVFWFNFPRSIWNVRALHEPADGSARVDSHTIETGLFHRKANNGPRSPFIPLKVIFQQSSVDIVLGDASLWDDERTVKSRVLGLLRQRPMTKAELGEAMPDVLVRTLETELLRLKSGGIIELMGTKGSPYTLAKKSL